MKYALLILLLATPLLTGAFQIIQRATRNTIATDVSSIAGSATLRYSVRTRQTTTTTTTTSTRMAADDDFWAQQTELAAEMAGQESTTLKQEQMKKYEERATGLVGDTAYFTCLVFPLLWLLFDNPLFSLSYLLGAALGLAYAYGLAKFVSSVGGSIDDTETIQGAGVGQARFAFLILLFVFVGKFRSYGLVELPCIGGFFTYQLASLSQGLKDFND